MPRLLAGRSACAYVCHIWRLAAVKVKRWDHPRRWRRWGGGIYKASASWIRQDHSVDTVKRVEVFSKQNQDIRLKQIWPKESSHPCSLSSRSAPSEVVKPQECVSVGASTSIGARMCSGSFAKCLGITLIPLAIVCVLCNILLFFPSGKSVEKENITDEVWYFGGILGSGVLVSGMVLGGDCWSD